MCRVVCSVVCRVVCRVSCVCCACLCVCVESVCGMGVSSCLALKTLPCVRSKRSHVYFQNARITKDTGVLNVHTRAFSTYTREHLSLFFSRLSPLVSLSSRVSLSLLLVSFSSRVFLCLLLVSLTFFLFSPSNNDNDHSSSRLSVYAQL